MAVIAITGATGFVGSHLVEHVSRSGHDIRCLVRPAPGRQLDQPAGAEWISGNLNCEAHIEALVERADTVIHLAGQTRGLGHDGFHETNCLATAMLVAAARRAGVQTFILVSSLAASRPRISPYAWSKALAEEAAIALAGDMRLVVLRPPAVLGPGDGATRDVISFLRRGWLFCPSVPDGSHFSWIDVEDLSRFILDIANAPPIESFTMIAPCSGQDITWQDVAMAAESVLDRKIRCLAIPRPLVRTIGVLASSAAYLTRQPLILSKGKAEELLQADWHADTVVSAPSLLHQTLSRCFMNDYV